MEEIDGKRLFGLLLQNPNPSKNTKKDIKLNVFATGKHETTSHTWTIIPCFLVDLGSMVLMWKLGGGKFSQSVFFCLVLQTLPTAFELQEKLSLDSKFASHVRQIRYFLNGWLKCGVNSQYDKSST